MKKSIEIVEEGNWAIARSLEEEEEGKELFRCEDYATAVVIAGIVAHSKATNSAAGAVLGMALLVEFDQDVRKAALEAQGREDGG